MTYRSRGKKGLQFNTYPVTAAGQVLSSKTSQGQLKSLDHATSPLQNLWSHLSQKVPSACMHACMCSAVHVQNDSINEKDQGAGGGGNKHKITLSFTTHPHMSQMPRSEKKKQEATQSTWNRLF